MTERHGPRSDDRPPTRDRARCALVTGAAGFIGSHLCERLIADGHRVVGVDDLSLGHSRHLAPLEGHPRFTFDRLDVAYDADRLDALFAEHGFDAVWHLAANSDIRRGSDDRSVDLERTFLTTYTLCEAAASAGLKRFCFASSSAVFGESARPLDERSGPLEPVSFYGAAKLASEAYLAAYAHRVGFDAFVFRFPNVVGAPATHGVILDLVNKARSTGRIDVLGDGTQRKPYLHVTDLIEGMLLALEHGQDRVSVFHLAGQGRTTVRDIAVWVAEAAGIAADRIAFGAGPRGWPGDVPRFEYDCSRIRAAGWRPRLDSDAAVRRAIEEIVTQEIECCVTR